MKTFSWKPVLIIVVVIAGLIYTLPTFYPAFWPYKRINLGLDLQGGMHLVLEVETQKAVESTIERIAQELRSTLKKEHIRYMDMDRVDGSKISVKISEGKDIESFDKLFDNEYADLRLISKTDSSGTTTYLMDLPDKETEYIKKLAADQALETIRNRIDEFGVSEPDIRRQGEERILIQLPGIKDTQRAKELIGRTALLEFKLLDDTHDIDSALKGSVPPGSELLYQVDENKETGRVKKIPYLVKKRSMLTSPASPSHPQSHQCQG